MASKVSSFESVDDAIEFVNEFSSYIAKKRFWYDSIYAKKFRQFFEACSIILRWLEEKKSPVSEKLARLLSEISNAIYENILNQTKTLLRTPADDPFLIDVIPLTEMYLMIANIKIRCKHFIPTFTNREDSFYYQSPANIEFCINNKLVFGALVKKVPICNFNIIELIGHLKVLETQFSVLSFCEELIDYVAALEFRVCEFLVTVGTKETHCVPASRVMINESKAVLTKKMQTELIFFIVSIRKHFTCTIQAFASYAKMFHHLEDDELNEDEHNSLIAIVYALIDAYRVIHDEQLQATFYTTFIKKCVYIRERFMFYNEFQVNAEINYTNAIKKYRSEEVWRQISSSSRRGLDYYLKNDEESNLAFRISFILMIKHVLMVKCGGMNFDDYFIDHGQIKTLTDESIADVMMLAEKIPIYIISLNEACVLWKNEVYIFGSKNYDYVRAIFFWIRIIHEECGDRILGIHDIRPIINTFRKAYANYVNFLNNTADGGGVYNVEKVTSCSHCSDGDEVYERTEKNVVYIVCCNCQKTLQSYDIIDPAALPKSVAAQHASSSSSSSSEPVASISLKFFDRICDGNLSDDSDDEDYQAQVSRSKQHTKYIHDLRNRTGFDALKSELVDQVHDGEGYTTGTNDSGWILPLDASFEKK
jgi:hypothetical protein